MTKNNKMRVLCATFAAVLILGCFTGCKNKQVTLSTDTDTTTATSDEVISTTESTTATTEATTVATTTATTVATTKAPTTKAPNKIKVTEKPTTKAPVTQAPTVKTQLDAFGQPEKVLTPEQICKERGWTLEHYKERLVKSANLKCDYCGKHDCASLTYLKDTNGDVYDVSINRWKCPTYVASEPKCERCGKKLCQRYDAQHPEGEYCMGKLGHAYIAD